MQSPALTKPPLRILAVTDVYPPASIGGMQLRLSVILRALEERGHSFTVLTSRASRAACPKSPLVRRTLRSAFDDPFSGGPHIYWSMRRQVQNVFRLRAAVLRYRPDLIYAWKLRQFSQSLYLCLGSLRVPVVFSFGDPWGLYAERDWPLLALYHGHAGTFARLKARTYSRVANILSRALRFPTARNYPTSFLAGQFNTQEYAKYYERLGFRFMHSAVIHNGVDTALFRRQEGRNRSGPIALIYVGRIAPDKGVEGLVPMMARIPAHVATLTMVGEGPLLPAIKQEASRLALEHVRFVPFVPRETLPALLSQHDVYVMPQRSELDGLTIDSGTLEAAACGLALILGDNPGHHEVFGESNAAILCPGPEQMIQAVHGLFERPSEIRGLGERARQLVEREFTLERMVSETERFLLRVRDAG